MDRQRLEMAVTEVSRLEGILRQLLDVAKPLALSPVDQDPNVLVQGCLDLLRPKLAERGIRLRRLLDASLGPQPIDPGKLEQALYNLLLNAMEAVPDGGAISVRTRARRDSGQRLLGALGARQRRRHGLPGPGADIHALFYQEGLGTGLGLTNVKRIAEAHGGRVVVESTPG